MMAPPRSFGSSRLRSFSLLVLLGLLGLPATAAAKETFPLDIRVVHGTAEGKKLDPKLEDLAKKLAPLKFKSLVLKDQMRMELEVGSVGRMQLPGGRWMTVKAEAVRAEAKLSLSVAVKKPEFKATVSVAPGATVVTRGPPYDNGTLILVITRVKP